MFKHDFQNPNIDLGAQCVPVLKGPAHGQQMCWRVTALQRYTLPPAPPPDLSPLRMQTEESSNGRQQLTSQQPKPSSEPKKWSLI